MSHPDRVLPSLVNWTASCDGLQGPSVIWNRPRRAPTPVGCRHSSVVCMPVCGFRRWNDTFRILKSTDKKLVWLFRRRMMQKGLPPFSDLWERLGIFHCIVCCSGFLREKIILCYRGHVAVWQKVPLPGPQIQEVPTRWQGGSWPGVWPRLHPQEPGSWCHVVERGRPWPPCCICSLF